MADIAADIRDERGEWKPAQAKEIGPMFQWPIRPVIILKRFFGKSGLVWRFFVFFAALSWIYLTPSMERMASFRLDWIALIYLRNALLLILVAGSMHLRLYIKKAQGMRYKYNDRWMAVKDKKFLFNNQTLDNVFYSLVSGCTIWTAYEALTLWAYANDLIPYVDLRERPVYSILLLIGIIVFRQVHFYWVHRFTHWKPLYKSAHYLHHRNVNIGPWSGLSMHPIEHLLYLSGIFIHWIIPSHPIHAIYHVMASGLGPAKGHAGFNRIVVGGKPGTENERSIGGGGYFHYLHHKFFTVNFGNEDIPFDKWFGSYHNGSPEAHEAMIARRKKRRSEKIK